MDYVHGKILGQMLRHVSGRRKNACAIVIPSADAVKLLEKHLAALSRQTSRNFDVIVIGKLPGKIYGLNVLLYREKYPLGSSGGFGIGQVLAYGMGYEYIINADVDCTPVSRNLVEVLIKRAKTEGKMVLPAVVSFHGGKHAMRVSHGPNQYNICGREMLELTGFEYFRFYRGAEDCDFKDRAEMGGLLCYENSVRATHKSNLSDVLFVLSEPGRKHVYYKKSMIIVHILLSHYCWKEGRLIAGAQHCSQALAAAVKTRLVHGNNPDMMDAINQGLLLDLEGVLWGSRTNARIIAPSREEKGIILEIGAENRQGRLAFPKNPKGLHAGLRIWTNLTRLHLMEGDFASPTEEFLWAYERLLPFVVIAKPVLFQDGKAYGTGFGPAGFCLNAAKTLLSVPFDALALCSGLAKAEKLDYPIKPANLRENLLDFLAYVKRADMKNRGVAKS